MSIENTTQQDPVLHLLGSLDGVGGYVEGMEAAGQRQLLTSDRLPTKVNGGTDEDFVAVGFTFGEPDPDDPLFRPATLPQGWSRKGSDHSMWSYLVDEHGRDRVSIFYKAAFYDRRAFMSLTGRSGYLWRVLNDSEELVLDDVWLTRESAVEELAKIAGRHEDEAIEAQGFAATADSGYWTQRAADCIRDRDKANALRTSLLAADTTA